MFFAIAKFNYHKDYFCYTQYYSKKGLNIIKKAYYALTNFKFDLISELEN